MQLLQAFLGVRHFCCNRYRRGSDFFAVAAAFAEKQEGFDIVAAAVTGAGVVFSPLLQPLQKIVRVLPGCVPSWTPVFVL